MNRKQKLIISITGITVVMLALLGLTYGYYLTRIQGNTNTNSISLSTADLSLKYDDGTSYINLTNIMPGTTTDGEGDNPEPKVFTVTNDGSNDVEYSVGMDEVTNTLTRTQDLTYSITCVEKIINASDTAYTSCATTPSNSGEYPKTNSYLFTNQIKQDYIQKYTVVISYANPDEDQSIDMGSTIKGRMQIYSVPESIDITGTVTGASSGDYVQINSNPKTSVIAEDGTYKLIGVEPGTHTLKVMNGSTTKGTKEIIVKQGTAAGISENIITFTESERVATVNVTSISTNLGVNITEIKDSTLKGQIIANAQKAAIENSTTKTILSDSTITTPLFETPAYIYMDGGVVGDEKVLYTVKGSLSKYYTYGDTYSYTTSYTILNSDGSDVRTVQGFSSLVGKYIVSPSGLDSSNVVSASGKNQIYYVVDVDDTTIYYVILYNGNISNEVYYTYGDTYEFNETTGKYTIKNSDGSSLKTVQYNTNYETLKNKFVVKYNGSPSSTGLSGGNLDTIYKISKNSTSQIIKYFTITKSSKTISYEKNLSTFDDEYGTSYYFRGGVQDNYVLFSNMCWRIVRIQGDGSIKITLAGEVSKGATNCNELTSTSALINTKASVLYGYKNITGLDNRQWNIADYENDAAGTNETSLKEILDTWFDLKFKVDDNLTSDGKKIKEESWCLGGNYDYKYDINTGDLMSDETVLQQFEASYEDGFAQLFWNYSTGKRINVDKRIDLVCEDSENKILSRIGTLTVDEVALAGGSTDYVSQYGYYLIDNAYNKEYWLLSQQRFALYYGSSAYDYAFRVSNSGGISAYFVSSGLNARPVIVLKNGLSTTKGNGTIDNPYVIN